MQIWICNLVLDAARYPYHFVMQRGQPSSSRESQTCVLWETLPVSHLTGHPPPPPQGLWVDLALMLELNPLDQVLEEKSKTKEESCAVLKVPDCISKQKGFMF